MPKTKLKIGFVLDSSLDPNDGVQQFVITLGEWMSSQGNDVHYLVGQTDHRQLLNIHSLARNINVRFNGNRTSIPLPTSKKKLKEFLEKENFDVLHVQIPHSPFMSQRLILAASPHTAIIGTFHIAPYSSLVTIANKVLGLWLKRSLKRFDKIVSVSPAAAEFALKTFKIKTEVIPNVLDYAKYSTAKPLKKYEDGKLTILFLGRLVKRKGCDTLLKAIKILNKEQGLDNYKVIIAGKGPLQKELNDYVNANKLQKIVKFVGFVDEYEKPDLYASADIAVFPSTGGESFGIVLIEAMANGRTVILAGDNPGYRSVMKDKESLIFDPNNPENLAKIIKGFILDADLRHSFARWGAEYTKNFDVAKVGLELLNIYRDTLLNRTHK